MWIIAGTIPDPDFSLRVPEREGSAPRAASLSEAGLHLPDGRTVPVERGTAALAATARGHDVLRRNGFACGLFVVLSAFGGKSARL